LIRFFFEFRLPFHHFRWLSLFSLLAYQLLLMISATAFSSQSFHCRFSALPLFRFQLPPPFSAVIGYWPFHQLKLFAAAIRY